MTTPDTKMLSAERLREISIRCADETSHVPLRVLGEFEVVQLLGHIKALEAELAAARAQVDDSEIAKVLDIGAQMIRDPDVPVSLSPFFMVSRQIITRLARERDEARVIEAALRSFPHFQDEPITAPAIKRLAGEYTDMVIGWAPVQTRLEFVDQDGETREIVHCDGDYEAGIRSGWQMSEDADWEVRSLKSLKGE